MSFLEGFLENYEEHIDNYDALLYILSLLPDAHQYIFTMNLLKYGRYLAEGSIYDNCSLDGFIEIRNDEIVLTFNKSETEFILLKLPPVHEI